MDLDGIAFDRRFGQPVVKDGCGVFGMLRKAGSPLIPNSAAINGISCIKYRGSDLGAGYAAFRTPEVPEGAPYRIQAFVTTEVVANRIRGVLEETVGPVQGSRIRRVDKRRTDLVVWEADLTPRLADSDEAVERAVDSVNSTLFRDGFEGRVFSYGRYLNVYKEVGFPAEVAGMWGLDREEGGADMWLAHTRQPTNSPGSLPIWSHPFASMNTAIVHNGDISSYGSNMELLNSWGIKSHVGTDSEVIARLLDHLLRIDGLSMRDAARVLTNPFERNITPAVRDLLYRYRGARLDGPFAVVAGYADGKDTYLVALTDRSKFRPLLVGEDAECFYVASEENQIRNRSRHARIWTPEPGAFFIASLRQGMIEPGTERNLGTQTSALTTQMPRGSATRVETVDATGKGFREINESISAAHSRGDAGIVIENCTGQRYLGIGITPKTEGREEPFRIQITGFPGNCLANLNDGATFEVFGNVADDLADTMQSGSIIVHGSSRDVTGQAIQGGSIFIRGTVGNRAAIQMREYEKHRPFLVVGETADDYLGEYMAGGIVIALNLSDSKRSARNYIGTGMVGGRIYIRGKIGDEQVGLIPQREDVLRYLHSQTLDGTLPTSIYDEISRAEYPSVQLLSKTLPEALMTRVLVLFFSTKYTKPVTIEFRHLGDEDLSVIGPKLQEFFETFALPAETRQKVLASEFTVIRVKEEKKEMPVPPQETPVEE
jgi:glutamate synthase domain-containing protein 1/glutamate synthase domain-containing protein 3